MILFLVPIKPKLRKLTCLGFPAVNPALPTTAFSDGRKGQSEHTLTGGRVGNRFKNSQIYVVAVLLRPKMNLIF